MNFHSLNLNRKKAIIIAAVAVFSAAGVGAVFAFGGEDASKAAQSAVQAAEVEKQTDKPVAAVDEEESVELEGLISFKKAGIEEYDMDFVASDIKLEVKKQESKEVDTPEHFTVKLPEDKSTILKPEKKAACYPGSRSIAGEYYTVYDEISGGHVTLNGHELICRIVNSEIGDSWGEEAIKAQAVAAYSYVRYNDECGYIPSVGLKAGYSSKLERCVSAVEGEGIYYNGSLIDAVYSASSAGASAPSEKIWGGSHPYLRAVESIYDYKDPNYGVVRRFSKDKLKSIIEKNTGIRLSDDPRNWFEIESVFSGKYIDKMKLDGKQYISVGGSQRRVTGALMRSNILGVDNLKSTAFEISYDNGVFTFKTFGWGHGVGMSQWGACYYAKAGYTYDQILRHYYTGTTIAVSSANTRAVERANKTQEQLEKEAEEAKKKQQADEQAAQEINETEEPSEPASTEPAETQPEVTQPADTKPAETEPAVTKQTEAQPEQPAQTEQTEQQTVTETQAAEESVPEQTEQCDDGGEQTEQPVETEEPEVLPEETYEEQETTEELV